MGAAGLNEFVQFINGGYSVYSKTGTLLNPTTDPASPTTDIDFWTAAGIGGLGTGATDTSVSDPHILFDPNTNRWFASEITLPATGNANQFLVGVSNTSNPLDGFKGYSFNANVSTGTLFADFDTLGVNSQGIYVGANMFTAAGGSTRADILAVSKADLLSAAASPTFKLNTVTYNNATGTTGVGFTARPVIDQDNGGTPTNVGEYVFGVSNVSYGKGDLNTLSGTPGTVAVTSKGDNVTWSSTDTAAPAARQLGSAQTIDTGDDRFSGQVVKQGGVVYTVQTVKTGTGGRAVIHVIGVNAATNATLIDQVISDPTADYYYPSLAINATGDVVIGCTGSSPTQYASGYAFVGKLAADGKSIAFGAPILTAQGQGSYFVDYGSGENRWGDYSNTTVDPSDPTRFWTVQEFAIGTDNWGTKITEIGIAAAPEPSALAALVIGALGLGTLALRARRRSQAA